MIKELVYAGSDSDLGTVSWHDAVNTAGRALLGSGAVYLVLVLLGAAAAKSEKLAWAVGLLQLLAGLAAQAADTPRSP